ncbi:indolepyruvate oxidoreductase subunit beta family protein [Microvirga yunnanensis]|uniref:indolepyruvate oxidoreductase subunit beta family protein n=1 Tax=Microvirga yunnanensis TaxID=2953740 RepID=UPI0021C9FABF|nr:indolepyruvate oxidoreductase subunit beta family protein [Microvirga sp. HBU65207]
MTRHETFPVRLSTDKPISIAILAMGGQGGGVLSDWIVALAESQGWYAQSTSVPGVAQRTGATIYYIEMLPARGNQAPILSLMPTPGDVDIVLAAEFMEAGRSMLRGLVTPERTTLIASNHRSYAVSEKEKPGDGIGDPNMVVEAAGVAAKRIITFDMQQLAEKNGSVISSAMFGALAAANVLPFPQSAFEATIKSGGKGIDASLRAFQAAFERATEKPTDKAVVRTPEKTLPELPASTKSEVLNRILGRIRTYPESLQPMLFAGVKRLVDYQDAAYAHEYLDGMDAMLKLDFANGGAANNFRFTQEAAKYLAVAMAYDDVIRVADLKSRGSRFERVRKEVGVKDDQLIYTTEYMHPRMEEVAGTLPLALGRFLESRPGLFKTLDRLVNRGRRVKSGTVGWFLALYILSAMKPMRRRTLRHSREMDHITQWRNIAVSMLPQDYDLAVEILACRRLVKGYSDTHARGQSKFDRVLSAVPMLTGRPDSAAWLRRLRQAALLDEEGLALDGALKTVASIYG